MPVIKTENLSKLYKKEKVEALSEFSLEIEKGQIFSILGPNGAGKTTLIKILLGIVFPSQGRAEIFDTAISDYNIHHRIGYLAENHNFPEFLNAGQVLYYYGKISGISANILKERIPSLLNLVNLQDWENVKIKKFSKGMLQRLGIAQALINDPELLFLDEPTDGIDPVGRREIRDLLKKLQNEGKTVLLNSHLLSEVERISDQAAILKNGKLLRKGSIQEFISVKEQYELKTDDAEKTINSICSSLDIEITRKKELLIISVKDDTHLNRLVDKLRQEDIKIKAIIPRKISLEDFFIEVIEEKDES